MSRASFAAQEESRLAAAAAAARAERQNQPRGFLYGAGLLLVISLIFVGTALRTSLAASEELDTQRAQADQVIKQAGRLKALRDAVAAEGATGYNQPATQILTRIEQAGVDVGLKTHISLPRSHTEPNPTLGSSQTRLDYEVRDEELPRLLQWVQKATENVPGLEVYSVSLKPDAHVWILKVTFSRWEKAQGK